jgi:hypothetical protein
VDGTLYVTMSDNAWAITDARDGHQLWHYFWKTRGGTHIGNRGFGMWKGYLQIGTKRLVYFKSFLTCTALSVTIAHYPIQPQIPCFL